MREAPAQHAFSADEPARALEWFPAPAKLNLFLHVLGRRADGLHELQTVLRLIDCCDRVGVRLRRDGRIARLSEIPGITPEQDLCLRAARLLQRECAVRLGADLALEKRIPIGGGLGGGSSDAATVLLALNRLWNLRLRRSELLALALAIGADVPFYVFGENAVGEGVGERLRPLDLPRAWYLVLVPQVAVSTAEIFNDGALTRDTKPLKIPPFLPGQGGNDLEAVAARRHPEIALHLAWLRKHRAQARMTGSGACVFDEFAQEVEATALLKELPAAMRGFVARGLERHPLHDWAA